MRTRFDAEHFKSRVQKKIAKAGGLRKAAQEAEVDYNALFRITRGGAPNVENYLRLIEWLTGRGRSR